MQKLDEGTSLNAACFVCDIPRTILLADLRKPQILSACNAKRAKASTCSEAVEEQGFSRILWLFEKVAAFPHVLTWYQNQRVRYNFVGNS